MDRYPPIAEHGLVGDLQTTALVSSQRVVDWFGAPRFDSPSIFAALLDHDGGGHFSIAPENPDMTFKQFYCPDTAILVTRFMSPDGVGEVLDFMPPDRTGEATDRHTLIRLVRAVRGSVEFTLECRRRFDYAGPSTGSTSTGAVPGSRRRAPTRISRRPSRWRATARTCSAPSV
jgi:GH15 family glucan-1,4-alpha-glucosidase